MMRIEIYLDDIKEPYQILTPPEKFDLDTEGMVDGEHKLTFKAIDEGEITSVRVVPFTVRNGPSIAIHGIVEDDTLSGTVSVLANAYGSRVGDEFEPLRMETPAPVPTWAWVLVLGVMAWGVGYITLEGHSKALRDQAIASGAPAIATAANMNASSDSVGGAPGWAKLGDQIYGNNCSSCHQGNGAGLPGVFPALANNSVVISDDPTEHIQTIINGLMGKEIDGVSYASPMPAFGASLSDEEIAAVVNHERTQWGNDAKTVTAADVATVSSGGTTAAASELEAQPAPADPVDPVEAVAFDWEKIGGQVYGNNCSSCHQGNGTGLPGVFPPLANNAVVLRDDPTEHIKTIIDGLIGKEIDGVKYAVPMPGFGATLTDEEIAAVVNHERTQWGNTATTVTPSDVEALR